MLSGNKLHRPHTKGNIVIFTVRTSPTIFRRKRTDERRCQIHKQKLYGKLQHEHFSKSINVRKVTFDGYLYFKQVKQNK